MSFTIDPDTEMIRRMEAEMQRVADEAMRALLFGEPPPDRFWQPRIDVYETEEAVVVKLELAGVDSSTLRVRLSGDDRSLTVSGERREDESERAMRVRCYRLEIYFGPFETKVHLPPGIRYQREMVTARYNDGILTVTLPRRQATNIPVTTAAEPE